jgi:hypothetical protein
MPFDAKIKAAPSFSFRKKTGYQTVRLDPELKGWVNDEALRLSEQLDNGNIGASTLIREALFIYRKIYRVREKFHNDEFVSKVIGIAEKF